MVWSGTVALACAKVSLKTSHPNPAKFSKGKENAFASAVSFLIKKEKSSHKFAFETASPEASCHKRKDRAASMSPPEGSAPATTQEWSALIATLVVDAAVAVLALASTNTSSPKRAGSSSSRPGQTGPLYACQLYDVAALTALRAALVVYIARACGMLVHRQQQQQQQQQQQRGRPARIVLFLFHCLCSAFFLVKATVRAVVVDGGGCERSTWSAQAVGAEGIITCAIIFGWVQMEVLRVVLKARERSRDGGLAGGCTQLLEMREGGSGGDVRGSSSEGGGTTQRGNELRDSQLDAYGHDYDCGAACLHGTEPEPEGGGGGDVDDDESSKDADPASAKISHSEDIHLYKDTAVVGEDRDWPCGPGEWPELWREGVPPELQRRYAFPHSSARRPVKRREYHKSSRTFFIL